MIMKFRPTSSLLVAALAFCAFADTALKASPVTVTEDGIGSNDTVYIDSSTLGNNLHVYAGIVDLTLGTGPSAKNFQGFASIRGIGASRARRITSWCPCSTPRSRPGR